MSVIAIYHQSWSSLGRAERTVKRWETERGLPLPFPATTPTWVTRSKDQAFRWLDIAYREHDRYLLGLNLWPEHFKSIRSYPRFY